MSKRRKDVRSMLKWEPLREAEVPAEGWIPGIKPMRGWVNDLYVVWEYEHTPRDAGLPVLTHLSIRRKDRAPVRDWRDFQRIKNEICGPEREGTELYPAESRLCDTANQYHLYVLPEGYRFGWGYWDRCVVQVSSEGAVQRPMTEPPPDAITQPDVVNAMLLQLGRTTR